jgi:CubicO group peptidase (beta-lactamase class C family)
MDLAVFRTGPWTQMGLPELSNGTGPSCSGLPGTRPCTINDFVNNVNSRPPIYAPFTGPMYSNIAFAILGLVIEAATGESFGDVAKAQIFDALGMGSTSFNGYVSSFNETGFVPVSEPTWNSTPGVFEA